MKERNEMKIFGLDISLDHGGIVVLNGDGKVINYCFLTATKKYIDVDPKHGFLLSKKGEDESKETFRLRRMKEYLEKLVDFERIMPSVEAMFFSIEGYSYSSKTTSICQIAELTGYLKHIIFEDGGCIRIHDPLSVKLFAVGKGSCMKKDIVNEALSQGFNIPGGLVKKKQVKKKESVKVEEFDGPATDLADAYFLANMIYIELKLRSGELMLRQLKENERRIFLRVTKKYPVNILDRSFVQK